MAVIYLAMIVILCVSWTRTGEFEIISGYYSVDNDKMLIGGIYAGASEEDVLDRLYCEKPLMIDGGVKTGAVITNGLYSYALAVTGDADGDGAVTEADVSELESCLRGETALSAAASFACDIDGDGTVNENDISAVKELISGDGRISGNKSVTADLVDGFYMLQCGTSAKLSQFEGAENVEYLSENDKIASVSQDGTVTAHETGTTMITARAGKESARLLITTITDSVNISLENSVTVFCGEGQTLVPRFNHPSNMAVTWQSSDAGVAEVTAEGDIKGVSAGSATITATLENGNTASTEINVVQRAESISFDKEFYKCKYNTAKKLGVISGGSNEPVTWTSSDESIATVGEDGTVYGVGYGTVTITATTQYTGLSAQCQVEICDFKQVALTFDDGPGMYTAKLLDFLREKDINATFFMIGNLISRYPETVKQMAADGHELGYHSYDHSFQTTIDLAKVSSDFDKTQQILYELTGRRATVWRSPGGFYNDATLNAVALPHIYWSVDTKDWEPKNQNAEFVKNSILSQAKDGAIILCHDIYSSTVDGAIEAIKVMLDDGYEFLTVTELLSRHGETPQASVTYKFG